MCGDSVVTLARIGWADAHARRVVNDAVTFDSLLLAPLQDDLVQSVWLYERYDDTGQQIRTSYYFEYPSLVTMMLREVRYGLEVGLNSVSVYPFRSSAPDAFTLAFGDTYLLYSASKVVLALPAPAGTTPALLVPKRVTIAGLALSRVFTVTSECSPVPQRVVADEAGIVTFSTRFMGSACPTTIERVADF